MYLYSSILLKSTLSIPCTFFSVPLSHPCKIAKLLVSMSYLDSLQQFHQLPVGLWATAAVFSLLQFAHSKLQILLDYIFVCSSHMYIIPEYLNFSCRIRRWVKLLLGIIILDCLDLCWWVLLPGYGCLSYRKANAKSVHLRILCNIVSFLPAKFYSF